MMDLGQGEPKKPRGKAKAAPKTKASKDGIKATAKIAPKKKDIAKKPASAKAKADSKKKPNVTRKESQARAKPSGNGGRKEKDTVEKKMHSVSCFWI